jgi:hypothetical protein
VNRCGAGSRVAYSLALIVDAERDPVWIATHTGSVIRLGGHPESTIVFSANPVICARYFHRASGEPSCGKPKTARATVSPTLHAHWREVMKFENVSSQKSAR